MRTPLAVLAAVLCLLSGCAKAPPTPIALGYSAASAVDVAELAGLSLTIAPFEDARTNEFLFRDRLVLEPGADAGVWVANALRMELEQAGAEVNAVESGVQTADGYHLGGRVHVVHAQQTGWSMGGVIGGLTSGLRCDLEVTMELLNHGVPLLAKDYRIDHNFKTDVGANILFGATPINEVPQALPVALRELIHRQILPDIRAAAVADIAEGGAP